MRPILIYILLLFCSSSIEAQTKEVSDTYEMHIKDPKILNALSVSLNNFDDYIKTYKHYIFKVYLTYYSPDDLEMILDYFTPKDTIQYTQPDHYFKYNDRIVFVYNGENLLTKRDNPDFHQYVLSVCREKMELSNSQRQNFSRPVETKSNVTPPVVNSTPPKNIPKETNRKTDNAVLVTTVIVNPTLKYSIRKRKDKVEITGLRSATI